MISTALYNEIAHTHLFEMEQGAFYNHARMFLTHYRELPESEKNKSTKQHHFMLSSSSGFSEKIYLGHAGRIAAWEELDDTDVVINVIRLSGPMMRYGGGCAYGSVEIRDMIMRAADVKQCVAQVFIVDTPGGSSSTKNDLKEAMDYAHSKGQETVMYVDGMVMSAGMAWASMCKKRYSRNPHNLFGCMGTYASFYTNKNGDVNATTQSMFHVIYADGSPNKNKPWRDSSEGDDKAILEMVNKENDRYKAIIKQGIPNVADEQLLGGEWEAQEVIGTLCDGVRTFDEVINEILSKHGLKVEASTDGSPTFGRGSIDRWEQSAQKTDDPEEPIDPQEPGDPNNPVDPNQPDNSQNSITKQLSTAMGKKYEKIQAALGLETLESGKDNSLWLHEEMADQLTAFVENAEHTQTALEAKQEEVNQLSEKVKQANEQVEQLNASLNEAAEKQEAFNKQLEELNKTIEAANADREALEAKISGYESMLAEQETKLAEKDAVIEEKEKAIAELSESPAASPKPAPAQSSQTSQQKPILASNYRNRKEAKAASEQLKQMLRDRM